jgi:hypothetical protein
VLISHVCTEPAEGWRASACCRVYSGQVHRTTQAYKVLAATTRGRVTTNCNHQPQSWRIFRLIWAPWQRVLVFPQRGDAAKWAKFEERRPKITTLYFG